tara:strand:+ start:4787 stop:6253 length:1467 start_codon:yes stop_codon:yes gene_type:complete
MAFTDRLHNRGSVSTGYDIDQSASFDYTRNQHLDNAMAYVSSRSNHQYKKMTLSMWVKRGSPVNTINQHLFSCASSARNATMYYNTSDQLTFYLTAQNGYNNNPVSKAKFRDHSAWYHIVVRMDTTLSTAADRMRLYVNGVQQEWDTAPSIDQNRSEEWTSFQPTTHSIGGENGYTDATGSNFDGQIAEVNYMANMSVSPDTFAEENTDGQWVPINTSSLSYDAPEDSYRIDFGATDSSNPYNDASGNGQHFSNDSQHGAPRIGTDTPTNNFMTWNGLTGHYNATRLFITGAGHLLQGQSNAYQLRMGTIGINPRYTNAKWYWEYKNTSNIHGATNEYSIGVATENRWIDIHNSGSSGDFLNNEGLARYLSSNNPGGNGTGANQVWGCMLDCSGGNPVITLYRDGSSFYTYTYTSWSGRTFDEFLFPSGGVYGTGSELVINSGGGTIQEFTVSSGNTDANGYGNFEYAPPSGALALCTKNLADDGGTY